MGIAGLCPFRASLSPGTDRKRRSRRLASVTLYLRGDQIGTYSSATSNGNGMALTVTLKGVQPLGSSTEIFRVVVNQVNNGVGFFQNGQMVSVYSYSEADPQGKLLYSSLNPQDDMFQGRASGSEYQVFSSPSRVLFDVGGVGSGTVIYSGAEGEALGNRLPFDALAQTPQELVICFTAGTRIRTAQGAVEIERLVPGDLVWTRDSGLRPVAWIGRRSICGLGRFAPIRIAAGTFGNGRALRVSPQHRILVTGWQAELLFGEPEVLVAACHLVDGSRIRRDPVPSVDYVHIAFDSHEIVCAEGVMAESLLPGPMALAALPREARDELEAIFPELALGQSALPALRCLSRHEAGVLRQRLA